MRRSTAGLAVLGALLAARGAMAQAEALPPELDRDRQSPTEQPQQPPRTATSPEPTEAAQPPEYRPRLLFMPYVGLGWPMVREWRGFNPAPRIGAMIGWRIDTRLSVNLEFDVEHERRDEGEARQQNDSGKDGDASFWTGFWNPPKRYLDLAASPMIELSGGKLRLGPRLGWFTSDDSQPRSSGSARGVLFGLNAGLFVPDGRVTIVGMVSLTVRAATTTRCDGCVSATEAHRTIALSGGVLL